MAKRTSRTNRGRDVIHGQYYLFHTPSGAPVQGRLDDDNFAAWLKTARAFAFSMYANYTGDEWLLSVRRESRRDGTFWYAYKTVRGHTYKVYVGTDDKITYRELAGALDRLQAKAASGRE